MNQSLLQKYIKGDALPEEKVQILEWIEAHPQNRKEFMQLRRLYDVAVWNDNIEAKLTSEITATKQYLSIGFVKDWMKVAAIIALTIGGTLGIQKSLNTAPVVLSQVIEVPQGQHVNLTLSDGTKVALNSNTKFKFPTSFEAENRIVELDGEGYFEVTHNAKRPFHVLTQKCDVKVLGTTFNVLAFNNSDIFETYLMQGSVRINDLSTSQKVLLKPNERVQMKDGKLVASRFASEDQFLWRNGIYVFKDESLKDIFKKIEQYYQVRIIVRNKELLTYRCTGKFRQKEGIEHVSKVLQKTKYFKYVRDEEYNTIIIR
jgi:transmembrane sensor